MSQKASLPYQRIRRNIVLGAALVAGLGLSGDITFAAPVAVRNAWMPYQDATLDFTVEYPGPWQVSPPPALSGLLSPLLTFTRPTTASGLISIDPHADLHAGGADIIHIGHYLYSIEEGETLLDWVTRYNDAFTEGEIYEIRSIGLGAGEAVHVRGRSPLTGFQFINIRRGDTVWFVWSNFDEAADNPQARILRRVAQSLHFGPRAPQNFQDLYGQGFQPTSLRAAEEANQVALFKALTALPQALSSSWYSPVLKSNGNMWSITCGSAKHTNGAYYAADVQATQNWQVLAAQAAAVNASGFDNSGYGNRVKLGPTSGYYHYYAHLIGIFNPVVVGANLNRGDLVGWVGNSGTTYVHLHFHVQNGASQGTSTGLTLVGMTGFADAADSYYPSNDGVSHYGCASMGR